MENSTNTKNNFGWTVKTEKKLLKTKVMTLMEQQTVSPEGNIGNYIVKKRDSKHRN